MEQENDSGNVVAEAKIAFAEKGSLKHEPGTTLGDHFAKVCPCYTAEIERTSTGRRSRKKIEVIRSENKKG